MSLKKPKILVVGSFMMDLIASAPRVPSMGETVIGTSFRTAPGGKGANQAVQCSRLGAHVTMAGCVGDDDFGRRLTGAAKESGVDISHVKVSKEHSSGVGNIQLEVKGNSTQNRILVVSGANYDLTPEDLTWLKDEIRGFDLVLLQLEMKMDVTKYAAACANEAGVPVMLNPAPAVPLEDGLLSCVTYLSPNEHEAALLTGLKLRADKSGVDKGDLSKVTGALRARGVASVIVTLGSNGAAIDDANGINYVGCVDMPEVKDPTAAGDSFVAAFCTGITAGLPQRESLDFASFVSAITVSRMGAMPSLPTIAEVQALMRERGYAGFSPNELDALK